MRGRIKYFILDGVFDTSLTSSLNINSDYSDYILILAHNLKLLHYKVSYHNARYGFSGNFTDNFNTSDVIIAVATLDNLHYIRNMAIPPEKLFLLQFNDSITKYTAFMPLFYKTIINFDEKEDLNCNLKKVIDQLTGINEETHVFVNHIDPDFKNNNNSFSLHINTGCTRACNFCGIRKSNIYFFPIDDIMQSIKILLNSGITHIKIANHLTRQHRPILLELANSIEILKTEYDFVISCTLIPEDYYDDTELMNLLMNANVLQVNVGIEHVSDDIIKDYDIKLNEQIITTFIKNICKSNIPSLIVHYIVGSSLETKESLNWLMTNSIHYIMLAPGIIEFNIHTYFDENKKQFEYEELSNTIGGYIRHAFIHKTPQIDKHEILAFKSNFFTEIMKKMYSTLNYKSAWSHVQLFRYNIQTQYYVYFYSKTIMVNIYDLLTSGWERMPTIEKQNIKNYIPRVIALLQCSGDKTRLVYDQILCPNKTEIEIDAPHQSLFRLLCNSNRTVGNLIHALVEEKIVPTYREAEVFAMNFFDILDSRGCLLFKKEVLCDEK